MNTKIVSIILLFIICATQLYSQTIETLYNDANYRNDSWSQNKLGTCYENGEGVVP